MVYNNELEINIFNVMNLKFIYVMLSSILIIYKSIRAYELRHINDIQSLSRYIDNYIYFVREEH